MTIKKGTEKADIDRLLDKLMTSKENKGVDAYKYCGVIKIKKSPEEIQKKLRNKWE